MSNNINATAPNPAAQRENGGGGYPTSAATAETLLGAPGASHTLGPWYRHASSFAGDIRDRHGEPICLVHVRGAGDPEVGKANARLIAAAPRLLEALRNFTDGRDISYVDALIEARAAIAEATHPAC